MRLLLVEDDPGIGTPLVRGLREEGYAVDWARDGPDARLMVAAGRYDAIILDRMLPVTSGDELLAEWRRQGLQVPILVLTALDAVADRVTGLRAGADDYLVKPFAFAELLARIVALVRRAGAGNQGPGLRIGQLALDPDTALLTCGNRSTSLSGREYAIMELFMRNPGRILTRDVIANACWQDPGDITDNAIEAQVKNLRRKLRELSPKPWLQTRRGLGYLLEAQP